VADDDAVDRFGKFSANGVLVVSRKPYISIVTPSFNQGAFISEALLSVSNQSYRNVEHLVIDGASQDQTTSILRRYSEVECWRHLQWISEADRGQGDALNKGFARATGEIVGWLNSDDRYLPGCFEHVVRAFERHPEVDIIYGDYRWIDEVGRVVRMRREIEFNAFILLYHRVLYIPTTSTFFRRRIFGEGNFLDQDLHYALDFEFFLRLALRGYRFKHIPVTLADFRMQKDSKTCATPRKQLAEKRQIMEAYSPLLRGLHSTAVRRLATIALSSSAAALRYLEKLIRGYYPERLSEDSLAP
jgi:glycosyltransferase involved in cell wall biosynthesis